MKKTLCSAIALCAVLVVPASAQSFDAPVQADVVQGWQLPNGQRVAALRLTLDPGWKTYWRAPGDAGIPPRFDWSRARNINDVRITWPQPQVFHDGGMRSVGYKETLIIPLHIAPKRADKPVRLKMRMDLGICSDVCAPFTLNFDATLDGTSTKPVPVIASALASAPFSAQEAGVRSATCRITPLDDGLQIETRINVPSAGGTEHTVIEAQPGIWVSEPKTHREGKQLVAVAQMMHASGNAFSLDRSDVRITILGSSHSVDIRGCSAG
ncbi:MAG: DsbC/DsbD-like thiol-disulfide interchange protein [Ascidiaceihabitans sp.]|jgi:DsbC/DsbD-like thiol-disulfide interchange protein